MGMCSSYTEDQRQQMRDIYYQTEGRTLEARDALPFPVSEATLRNYWNSLGFPRGKQGGNRYVEGKKTKRDPTGEYLQGIIKGYQRYDGNPVLASKSMNTASPSTIEKCWRQAGLRIRSRSKFGGLERKISTPF